MRLSKALAEGRRRTLEHVPITHEGIAFLHTPAAPLVWPRSDAAAQEYRRQPAPGGRLGEAFWPTSATHPHPAAALSHLLAHRELPGIHDAGAENVLITNPRDIPVSSRKCASTALRVHRRQHALQCAVEQRRFAKLDFSSLRMTLGGAWRYRRQLPSGGNSHRRARSRRTA